MPSRTLMALSLPLAALAATPAIAHPGEHGQMSVLEFINHYAEPDHLVFLALTVIVGYLAYQFGRRTEARAGTRGRRGGKGPGDRRQGDDKGRGER